MRLWKKRNRHIDKYRFRGLRGLVNMKAHFVRDWLAENPKREGFLVDSLAELLARYEHEGGELDCRARLLILSASLGHNLPGTLMDGENETTCSYAYYALWAHDRLLTDFLSENQIEFVMPPNFNFISAYPTYDSWLVAAANRPSERMESELEAEQDDSPLTEEEDRETDLSWQRFLKFYEKREPEMRAREKRLRRECPICNELLTLKGRQDSFI